MVGGGMGPRGAKQGCFPPIAAIGYARITSHRFGRGTGIRMSDFHGKGVKTMPDEPVQGKGKEGMDATQWHEVKKGDTLSKIAEKYYGDPGLYPTIFEANRDRLKDPNLIKIGQKLRIP